MYLEQNALFSYQYRLASPVDRSGRRSSEVYVQHLNILSGHDDDISVSHYYLAIRQIHTPLNTAYKKPHVQQT